MLSKGSFQGLRTSIPLGGDSSNRAVPAACRRKISPTTPRTRSSVQEQHHPRQRLQITPYSHDYNCTTRREDRFSLPASHQGRLHQLCTW